MFAKIIEKIINFYEWYLDAFKEQQISVGEYHTTEIQSLKNKGEAFLADLKALKAEIEDEN